MTKRDMGDIATSLGTSMEIWNRDGNYCSCTARGIKRGIYRNVGGVWYMAKEIAIQEVHYLIANAMSGAYSGAA